MSYRLLRITNFYNEYLNSYYLKYEKIGEQSYREQYNHLINDSVEMVSSYSKYLSKIGVDAIDIVSNATTLQNTWALENDLPNNYQKKDLLLKQIQHKQPDVLWLDDSELFSKEWLRELKLKVPSIKLLVGHICAPYNSEMSSSFSFFDIMFTCVPCMMEDISKYGVKTELLYHGFDQTILNKVSSQNLSKKTGLIFTGSLYTGYGFHKTRINYIEKLIENNIPIKIYGNLESRKKILLKQSMFYTINFLKAIKCNSLIDTIPITNKYKNYGEEKVKYYSEKLLRSSHPPIFGLDMYKAIAQSLLCFNIHGEIAKNCAGNVRLFEATGIGTCLITDWKKNLSDLFEIDKEIVAYHSLEDCIEKTKWLINNPVKANEIAIAGHKRTLKDHTIEKRAMKVHQVLTNYL